MRNVNRSQTGPVPDARRREINSATGAIENYVGKGRKKSAGLFVCYSERSMKRALPFKSTGDSS
ncbi:MAG TPA: hypothetical protein PK620_13360 [Denitromonas sp.]|uniref:hypothetical protein n=1 Tax=Denitromonas sp. TaxID=2734609 RepID=UPI001DA7182D|nr:hypothetical protein [Rhodocyclaceae bacterium]MCP5222250.1 hypothetical protein [Zoogloeaceae bacterium]HPR06155.1 hypothetical protein [Denitromonas sp.]HQU88908.1 hypothetical protein [Denitromonas sp.]HQV15901.1 hypothetical protein [Denitromonas sp.]